MESIGSLKFRLESNNVVSGDHIKGRIISKSTSDGLKVSFSFIGIESIKINPNKESNQSHSKTVIDYTEILSHRTTNNKEVFLLKLLVPSYLPSSFQLTQNDNQNNSMIEASLCYKVIARLDNGAGKTTEKAIEIAVTNVEVRKCNNEGSSMTGALKSCFCIPRGFVNISIKKSDDQSILEDHQHKYILSISSNQNSKLVSIVAMVIFEFEASISEKDSVKITKPISRQDKIDEVRDELMDNKDIYVDLDFSKSEEQDLEKYSVTKGILFKSRVFLRAHTVYDVGCRSKYFQLDHDIFVPPRQKSIFIEHEHIEEYRGLKEIEINPGEDKANLYVFKDNVK